MSNAGWLLVLIGVIYTAAFWLAYPRWVGSEIKRLVVADSLVTLAMLLVVGARFWGQGVVFDLWLFETNWFWASLVFYLLVTSVQLPLYCRRFGIQLNDFGR